MISHLRKKGQITIPVEILKQMGLKESDSLDFKIINNRIVITPVEIVEKEFMNQVREEHDKYKETKGKDYKVYENVDELIKDLDE